MSYYLEFSKTALEDIDKHKKAGDRTTLKKIEKLLNELREHPTTGSGKPEILKHDFQGFYSRRINEKHRLIYSINELYIKVLILSMWSHYGDR